jgi:hypothetical protein
MIGPSEVNDYNLQFIATSLIFVDHVTVSSHGLTANLEGPGLEEDCFTYHFDSESDMIYNLFLGYLGEPSSRGDLSPASPTSMQRNTVRGLPTSKLGRRPAKHSSDTRSFSTTSSMATKQVLVYLQKKGISIDVLGKLILDILKETANASTPVEKSPVISP